jgi:hypothetical protein
VDADLVRDLVASKFGVAYTMLGIWYLMRRGGLTSTPSRQSGRCSSAACQPTRPRQLRPLGQVIRHGLKKIQYQPGLIEGWLAGTGRTLEPDGHPTDIKN